MRLEDLERSPAPLVNEQQQPITGQVEIQQKKGEPETFKVIKKQTV